MLGPCDRSSEMDLEGRSVNELPTGHVQPRRRRIDQARPGGRGQMPRMPGAGGRGTDALAVITLGAFLLVGLVACGDGDGRAEDAATSEPTTVAYEEGRASALGAFCAQVPARDEEVAESYVGSEQHVADLGSLIEVAPDEVRQPLVAFRDFVEAEVDPARPDSQLVANWPARIGAAVQEITQFVATTCP